MKFRSFVRFFFCQSTYLYTIPLPTIPTLLLILFNEIMMYVQMYMNVELIKHKAKLCFNNEYHLKVYFIYGQTNSGFIIIYLLAPSSCDFVHFSDDFRMD